MPVLIFFRLAMLRLSVTWRPCARWQAFFATGFRGTNRDLKNCLNNPGALSKYGAWGLYSRGWEGRRHGVSSNFNGDSLLLRSWHCRPGGMRADTAPGVIEQVDFAISCGPMSQAAFNVLDHQSCQVGVRYEIAVYARRGQPVKARITKRTQSRESATMTSLRQRSPSSGSAAMTQFSGAKSTGFFSCSSYRGGRIDARSGASLEEFTFLRWP